MKVLIVLQKVLAMLAICTGMILSISDAPVAAGVTDQAWLTCGGIAVVGMSLLWVALISWEEDCLEAGKKAHAR